MLNLGVHVSIAGKIYFSIDRAQNLGCTTMQIFARSPRQFRKNTLKDEDIQIFRRQLMKSDIDPLVIHSAYTLNLGAAKKFLYEATIKEFSQDVIEADKLGAKYIVIHTGSFKKNDRKGLELISASVERILKNTKGCSTHILLENTSGDGSNLGYKFWHHKFIFDRISNSKRLGLCIDTAHAWCAGYKINTQRGLDDMINEIDVNVGIDKLKVIHCNDTADELGSHKDRHANIGEGKIGSKGFSLIINHPVLKKLPFILETPKKNENDDKMNMNRIRRLYKK